MTLCSLSFDTEFAAKLMEIYNLFLSIFMLIFLNRKENALLSRTSLLNEMIDDWKEFLNSTTSEQDIKMLQQHERTGRPLGSDGFLTHLEKSIDRLLRPKRPGRKPMKGKK